MPDDTPPPQDPFEMFRRLWGPLGVPIPGMAVPTFDPQEGEKRIAELRSVEAWRNMNLNMLTFSIQGLALQGAELVPVPAGHVLGDEQQVVLLGRLADAGRLVEARHVEEEPGVLVIGDNAGVGAQAQPLVGHRDRGASHREAARHFARGRQRVAGPEPPIHDGRSQLAIDLSAQRLPADEADVNVHVTRARRCP